MNVHTVTIADVDFTASGNSDQMTTTGLSRPKQEGSWTLSETSSVDIPVWHPADSMKLTLTLKPLLRQYLSTTQTLTVNAGQVYLGAFSSRMADWTTLHLTIPKAAVGADGILRLHLRHPTNNGSARSGLSADAPPPGFLLQRMTVFADVKEDRPVPPPIPAPVKSLPSPPTLAGEALLTFELCHTPGSFGRGARHEKLQLFPSMEPLPQLPYWTLAQMPQLLIDEHFQYLPPPDVNFYAIHEGQIWGNGIVTSGTAMVINADIFPGYFRGQIRDDGHSLPIEVLKPERWARSSYLRCDRPVACFFHPNVVYGHFLLEMLPKIYLLRQLKALGCDFIVAMSLHMPQWVKTFLELYFTEEDLLYYNPEEHIISAPSIIMPSMMQTSHNFHPCFNMMVADLQQRVGVDHTLPMRRLFLSRSRIPYHRRLLNETEIEQTAIALGLEIVHPQELSAAEQIQLFASASLVVGEYSSALHNTLFAPFGCKVVAIDMYSWYQSAIGRLRQQPLAFLAPTDGQFRHWRTPQSKNRVYEIDPAALRHTVERFCPG